MMEIESLTVFFLFLFQLLLLKMPNNLSKQKMPAYGKLLPMKITGRIFFFRFKRKWNS